MTWHDYWRIFWKTFAQGAAAVLVVVQGYDWATPDYHQNLTSSAVLLGGVVVMALIATGYAYVKSPATTALQKATRSFVEWVVAGSATVAFNSVADLVSFVNLLVPLMIGAVLAFGVTYFMNQSSAPTTGD